MGEMKAAIIPTRSKAKISHELSFPIGAERISVALASAMQFPQLVLDFRSDYFNTVRSGRYPFLRVMYSCAEKPIARPFSSGVPTLNEWSIAVWPVPRAFRHRIQRYILDSVLTQIKQWLDHRVDLAQPGSEFLTFSFDEKKEEFAPVQVMRLQPTRGSRQKTEDDRKTPPIA